MTRPTDPPRLLDPSSGHDEARRLLESARLDEPTPARLSRVATRLGPVLSTQLPATAGAGVLAKAAWTVGALLAVLGAGAGLWWSLGGPALGDAAAPAHAPVTVLALPPASAPVLPALPSPTAEQLASSAEAAALGETAPSTVQVQPSPPSVASTKRRPSEASSSQPPGVARPLPGPDEAALLQEARRALKEESPARALELVNEHQARFPRGLLAQEREVLGIETLLRLGSSEQARERAARFRSDFPGSAHQRRVEWLLRDSPQLGGR